MTSPASWNIPAFGSSRAKRALKAKTPNLAVVIKGNPFYLSKPAIKPLAEKLYAQIQEILESRGYQVEFDKGAAYTVPNRKADVWIAHSRGIDRLRFAPPRIKTWAIQTALPATIKAYDQIGNSPAHYVLNQADLAFLNSL